LSTCRSVERHRLQQGSLFQMASPLNNTHRRERHWRLQTELPRDRNHHRTGRRRDQRRHRAMERVVHRIAEDVDTNQVNRRSPHQHDPGVLLTKPFGELLRNRSFRLARIPPCRSFAPTSFHWRFANFDLDRAVLVHRSCENRIADLTFDRNRFSGHRGLIDNVCPSSTTPSAGIRSEDARQCDHRQPVVQRESFGDAPIESRQLRPG